MTNKQMVLIADPDALLDYYESLRGNGKPCWFIRSGIQGPARTGICSSPRAAWAEAADSLRAALTRVA